MPEIVGGEPSTVIALVETIIGKWVPSRRTPVISTSLRCAVRCPIDRYVARNSPSASWRSAGTIIATGWPTISVAVQPNITSAAALNDPTVPSKPIVRIPSAAFSTTAR